MKGNVLQAEQNELAYVMLKKEGQANPTLSCSM